jgi:large subunit ribosomal protein L23
MSSAVVKSVEPVYIIKRPILTEKSTYLSGELKQYAFEVAVDATKTEIKMAIEQLYKVRVLGINTQVRKGKFRRMRYGLTQEPTTKKATIRVHQDDAIELF